MDSTKKSIYKTLSWRFFGMIVTFLVGYVLTGNVTIAGTIASVEIVLKSVLYYIHERLWSKF